MSHVFISYVHENTRVVTRLYEALNARGIRVWVDRNDIAPGTLWQDAIRNAISEGDFFIACFSKEYNNREKTYMNEELNLAIEELRKRPKNRSWFIPVLLSGEIPEWDIGNGKTLRDIQWVELKSTNWQRGLEQILGVVCPLGSISAVPKQQISIPVVETPDSAKEHSTDQTFGISKALLPADAHDLFAFSVAGDSLQNALIYDGDVVVIQKQATAENGDLMLMWLRRQKETAVFRTYKMRDKIRLQPVNPTLRPIIEQATNVEYRGKVVLIARKLTRTAHIRKD